MNTADGASSPADIDPLLTVIVTIVEGGPAIAAVLESLASQRDPPPLEVIVPHDDTVEGIDALRTRFPAVRFLDMGHIPTEHPRGTPAAQHELFDRRRAVALAAATGELVAIVEDRGLPRSDWARTAVRLHRAPWAVIGGAIESASSSDTVSWALHVCDYSRYELPFAMAPREWVSDVNVVYKRRAVDSTRSLWIERYQEPVVHWDLIRRGEQLYLSPDLLVDHVRRPVSLATALGERFAWGRLFGHIRARHLRPARRILLIGASPLIAPLVIARHALAQTRRGRGARFVRALPALALLVVAWTAGEVWGYVTGRP